MSDVTEYRWCSKCNAALAPCDVCGRPSQCGDAWCAEHVPDDEPPPKRAPVSDATEYRWKVFTYDADGRYIEEIDAPGGQLVIDLNTLNARNPDVRVRYLVARETTRPVPRETR